MDQIYRVIYKVIADYSEVSKSAKQAAKDLGDLNKAEERVHQSSIKRNNEATDSRRRAASALAHEAKEFDKLANALYRATGGYTNIGNSSDRASRSVNRVGAATSRSASQVSSLSRIMGELRGNLDRTDRSSSRASRSIDHIGRSSRSSSGGLSSFAGNALRTFTVLSKFGKFSIIGTFFAGVAALVPSLTSGLAGLAGVALAAANALATLSGVGAALPSVFAAIGGAVATLGVAFSGVLGAIKYYISAQKAMASSGRSAADSAVDSAMRIKDAELALADARINAQRSVEDAERRVEDAERRRARSLEDVKEAQEDLNEARQQALKDLQDLREEVAGGALDEEGAQTALLRAQDEYKRALADPSKTAVDRAEALYNLHRAEKDLEDVQKKRKKDQDDLNDAERDGVEGSDRVVDAKRRMEDATRDVTDAEREYKRALEDQKRAQVDATRAVERALWNLKKAKRDDTEASGAGTSAMNAYNDALKKMSPSARAFTKAIVALRSEFDSIRRATEEAFFSRVMDEFDRMTWLIPIINAGLTTTAATLGDLAAEGIRMVTSGPWTTDFGKVIEANQVLLKDMGRGGFALADAFRSISVTAIPMAEELTADLADLSEEFNNFIQESRESGDLEKFFTLATERARTLGRTVRNIGSGFVDVIISSNDFTSWLLDDIEKLSKKWKKWGEEQKKPNSDLRKFLTDVRPALEALGSLIIAIVKELGKFASDPKNIEHFTKLAKKLEEDILPKLSEALQSLAELEIDIAVLDAVSSLLDVINTFLDNGGGEGLKAVADAISSMAGALEWLVKIPGVAEFIGLLAGIAAIAFVAQSIKLVQFGQSIVKMTTGSVGGLKRLVAWLFKARQASDELVESSRKTSRAGDAWRDYGPAGQRRRHKRRRMGEQDGDETGDIISRSMGRGGDDDEGGRGRGGGPSGGGGGGRGPRGPVMPSGPLGERRSGDTRRRWGWGTPRVGGHTSGDWESTGTHGGGWEHTDLRKKGYTEPTGGPLGTRPEGERRGRLITPESERERRVQEAQRWRRNEAVRAGAKQGQRERDLRTRPRTGGTGGVLEVPGRSRRRYGPIWTPEDDDRQNILQSRSRGGIWTPDEEEPQHGRRRRAGTLGERLGMTGDEGYVRAGGRERGRHEAERQGVRDRTKGAATRARGRLGGIGARVGGWGSRMGGGRLGGVGRVGGGVLGAAAGIGGTYLASKIGDGKGGGRDIAGGALSGAMSGAATGAMIGSIIPGVGTAIGGAVGGVFGALSGGIKAGGGLEKTLKTLKLDKAFESVKKALTPIGRWFQDTFSKTKKIVSDGWNKVKGPFFEFWKAVWPAIKVGWKVLSTIFKVQWKIISTILVVGWKVFHEVFKVGFKVVWEIVKAAWKIISTIFKVQWTLISTAVKVIWKIIDKLFIDNFKSIKDTVTKAWTAIKKFFTDGWNAVKDGVNKAWTAIKKFFTEGWTAIKKTVTDGWNSVKKKFTDSWDSIKTKVSNGVTYIRTKFSDGMNGISKKTSEIWGSVKSKFTNALDSLKGSVKSAVKAIGGIWDDLKKKLQGPVGYFVNTIVGSWVIGNVNKVLKFLHLPEVPVPHLKFATGGHVPGTGSEDTVNAKLTPGEYVIKKSSVKAIGRKNLDRLNQADKYGLPKFALGGFVGDIWKKAKGAAGKVRDAAVGAKDLARDGAAKALEKALGPVRKVLSGMGTTGLPGMFGGLGNYSINEILKFVRGQEGKVGGNLGPINPKGNAKVVKDVAEQMFGWTGSQWGALYQLVKHESGFNNRAQNPTSSAYGAFQFLDSTWGTVGGHKTSDIRLQSIYGGRYIKRAYGNPANAWAKWQSRSPHWYSQGGEVKPVKFNFGGMVPQYASSVASQLPTRVLSQAARATGASDGFSVGTININNPVAEKSGESLYRTVDRLNFMSGAD